jgi:integrase
LLFSIVSFATERIEQGEQKAQVVIKLQLAKRATLRHDLKSSLREVFKRSFRPCTGCSLYNEDGQRKYLTPEERDAFLKAAEDAPREVRTFCRALVYTGCRIAEAVGAEAKQIAQRTWG